MTVSVNVLHTRLGDEEELVCHVEGVPRPTVTWYHEGNVVDRRTSNILIHERLDNCMYLRVAKDNSISGMAATV